MTDILVSRELLERMAIFFEEDEFYRRNSEEFLHGKLRAALDAKPVEPVASLSYDAFRDWFRVTGSDVDTLKLHTKNGSVPVYLAPPAPVPVKITDEMAYAFHRVIDDLPLGASDVKDIKDGLRAAFANAVVPVPAVPDGKSLAEQRWNAIETLMILGDVELTQTADGGYGISLEPVESIAPQYWEGDTPDEAIDKVVAKIAAAPASKENEE